MEEVRKDREDNACDVEDEDDDAKVVVARQNGNACVGRKNLDVLQDVANANSRCHQGDVSDEREDSLEKDVGKTPQSPAGLAFTIDFGDGSKEVDTAKYQNLFQRFSRHRRNVSTSKIEIKTSKSSVDLSQNFVQKNKPVSNYSEGYFSSEDDTKRKADKLSQKLKELGLKTSSKGVTRRPDVMSRSLTSKTDPKRRSYPRTSSPPRPDLTLSSTMNDLSRLQSSLEDDRSNRVQYSPEKKYTKNIEYLEINHSYSSENLHQQLQNSTEKLKNTNYTPAPCNSSSTLLKQQNVQTLSITYTGECSSNTPNIDKFSVSNLDNDSDVTVSEAGTYTVHKDYTDEEKARMDIDKTFSVGVLTKDEQNESYVHHFQMNTSRDSNSWISEWATQVAEHNSLPPAIGGTTARTPPLSPSKIPSPIYSRSKRLPRSRCEQSDSSIDAETHQRMNNNMIDSGGESDEDTSNSYPTPPHSSQRTPTHSALVRRGSMSETLFKRVNTSDCRRSMRHPNKKEEINMPKSPSHMLARLHLDRSNSLEKGNSDTASNSSRRSSLRNYPDESYKHTNSPILNRLRSATPKLTNSPILGHKTLATKMLNTNMERPKQLIKPNQSKNVGYFTCVESSPYMLRKSLSTSNYREETYREETSPSKDKLSMLHGSPMLSRNMSIQRSASNTSIRNTKTKSMMTRRSSFNDNSNERLMKSKLGSDSSSETGEPNPVPPISSGIKLNRTFSMRRARLSCESESTPNTTPEERRRRAQSEIKSAPCSARQPHHRGRTSSMGAGNKEIFKKPEPRPRGPSLSRTEGGRYSMRAPKTTSTRSNQKPNKESKNSGRSNSTLTSKEVEFQNWKRRKNYDPMKAAAEGKKKLDVSRKHHSIEDGNSRDSSVLRSASFHGTGGVMSLADDWSDNEISFGNGRDGRVQPPPCSPLGSDSDLDTSSYLQTTHNVMSAMSARINVYQTNAVDSGGESDEDTSHSLRQNKISTIAREMSDTESSDEQVVVGGAGGNRNVGFNRNFVGRRSREGPEAKSAPVKAKVINNARSKSEGTSIARTDSGRFSVRLAKGSAVKVKPKDVKKKESLVKEQEMQNWKRRKSYDPMKAAMEGKRKAAGLIKRNVNSESSSVLRSQSFHGPVTLGLSEWSDEDISASADEAPIY